MLSYFPQVRDEESTYSIFSRLQFAIHPPNFEIMGKMIFNRKFEVGRLNFQGSFDFLCTHLPPQYNSEKFLYNNTIFPIYIPFINKEKQKKAINYFKGDYADKIQKCLNISEITQTRTYIRFCKECAKEDFDNHGEPFYRRQHEIELNRMCEKHRMPLYEYVIFPYKIPSRYNDFYTVLNGAEEIAIPENFKSKFLDIANDISCIFTADLTGWDIQITKDKIYNRMINKGYVSVNGSVYQKTFSRDFKEYYTEEFLNYIGFNFDIDENDSWIRYTTVRKKSIGDPVKYLLVIKYLFGSFQNFYKYKDRNSIFKIPPYPCLNIICPNYNILVINDCSISISHNHPLATFKCQHCGFTYSRRGPDREDEAIYKKTYVKDYGHIWLNKLKDYASQGLSLRKMSKLLGCSDIGTIKSYIQKIRLNKKIERYAKTKVSQDEPLLIENNLLKKEVHKISNNNRLKTYWMDKDKFLCKELIKSLEKIKSEKELYKRITIALLQKHIGYYNLHQNKSKLPKCFNLITLECETIPQYQKRRIDYVVKQIADSNKKITFAKVLHDAGLRNRASKEILDYIEVNINEYNQGNVIKN